MQSNLSAGIEKYVEEARRDLENKRRQREKIRNLNFDTLTVHGMYTLERALREGNGGIIEPIFASTSQAYKDSDEMEAALAYLIPTWCYSRIHNPTIFYLEETLSLLETYRLDVDASALCTASGMAAIKQAIEPFLVIREGDREVNFVSSAKVYGGTFQLFNVRMRERGAQVRWVTKPWLKEEWASLIDENTRFLYAEMPSNPQLACFDIKEVAELAHKHEIPLIVDSTIATPALLRPIEYGADVVIHSLTKSMGSGGASIGGALIARHHIVSRHLTDEAKEDYAAWLKLWPFRDSGPCMSPYSAFFFLNELRTLRMKVKAFSENTMKVARFLAQHPAVERVDYLGLESHPLHNLAKRYMKLVDTDEPAFGHLLSFNIRGTKEDARRFFDRLQLIFRATDLGRIKSCATIPAISTHQQQGEEGRKLAEIPPTMVRLCVGAEDPEDIIADLEQALAGV